jgi:hypothetical protein
VPEVAEGGDMAEEPTSFVMIGPSFELPTPSFPAVKISGLEAFWDYDHRIREESPIFQSAKEAVEWALARSTRVFLRMDDGVTYWVGTDPCPDDYEQLTAQEAETMFATIIGTSLPLTESSETNRRLEAERFKVLRQAKELSVHEVAERSGMSQAEIEAIEDCSGPYESNPRIWIDLVRAICGAVEEHRIQGGWVIEEGGMLSAALKACELDEAGNTLGKS